MASVILDRRAALCALAMLALRMATTAGAKTKINWTFTVRLRYCESYLLRTVFSPIPRRRAKRIWAVPAILWLNNILVVPTANQQNGLPIGQIIMQPYYSAIAAHKIHSYALRSHGAQRDRIQMRA
jgi:hypothetical protein